MAKSPYQTLVESLSPEARVVDEKTAMIDLDVDLTVEVHDEEEDVIGLFAELGMIPEPSVALLKHICEANFGCAATGGGTIGWDSESGSILLCRYWSAGGKEADETLFVASLFIETASVWAKFLKEDMPTDQKPREEPEKQGETPPEKPVESAIEMERLQTHIRI